MLGTGGELVCGVAAPMGVTLVRCRIPCASMRGAQSTSRRWGIWARPGGREPLQSRRGGEAVVHTLDAVPAACSHAMLGSDRGPAGVGALAASVEAPSWGEMETRLGLHVTSLLTFDSPPPRPGSIALTRHPPSRPTLTR